MLTMGAVKMSYHHIVETATGGKRKKLPKKKTKQQDATCAVLSSWSNAWVIYLKVIGVHIFKKITYRKYTFENTI